MNIVIRRKEDTDINYEQIVELMHAAFEERLQQGLNFSCSFMNVEQFKEKSEGGTIVLAINQDTNELVGVTVVLIKKDFNNETFGFNEFLSVNPKVKRCGIESILYREGESVCNENKCKYIKCTTAVGAKSSVKYHLKNGFKIIGLESFPTTNYYSYIFRKQLVPSKKWENNWYCKFVYYKSYIKTKLTKKEDGTETCIYKLYKKVAGNK